MSADLTREQAIMYLVENGIDMPERLNMQNTDTLLRWAKFLQEHAFKEAA